MHRRTALAPSVALPFAVAILAAVALLASCAGTGPPLAWSSDEVLTRTFLGPLPGDPYPGAGGPGPVSMTGVAPGGPGFVAFGQGSRGPVSWTSTDGATWDLAPEDPALDGSLFLLVTPTRDGLLGLTSEGVAWTSEDGATWRPAGGDGIRPGEDEHAQLLAVSALRDGSLVAVASVVPRGREIAEGSASLGFWRSDDGVGWRRLQGPRHVDAYDARAGIAPFEDGWVVVGPEAVSVSTDGETWQTVPAPAPLGTVATLGDRLVAATADPGGEEREMRGTVWISSDGLTWESTGFELPGPTEWSQLVAGDDDVAWLAASSLEDDWWRLSLWRSPDGEAWERLDSTLLDGTRATGLASAGGRIVLVGEAERADDLFVATAWTDPPVEGLDVERRAPSHAPWVEPRAVGTRELQDVRPGWGTVFAPLPDGRVLAAGGFPLEHGTDPGGATIPDVRLIDPATGSSEPGPSLPAGLRAWDAAAGPGGEAYVVGSLGGSGTLVVLRLDPGSPSWERLPVAGDLGSVVVSVSDGGRTGVPRMAALADGGLLLVGPERAARLVTVDPATGAAATATAPFSGSGAEVVATRGGVAAFAGWRAWRSPDGLAWEPGSPMPHPVDRAPVAAALPDGRVAVLVWPVAGPDRSREWAMLDLYDLATDTWTTGSAIPASWEPARSTGLQAADLVALTDGRLFLAARGYHCPADECGEGGLLPFSRSLVLDAP